MKKALLPLAIAASLPMSAMAVGPIDGTTYGKINLAVINQDVESKSTDSWDLNSNASRFGFKGKTALTENLNVIYKMEWEVSIDDDNNTDLKSRNRYVGLNGSAGTLFAGRHDTVLKLSQKKVDLFNDLDGGDVKNWMSGETRANNVVNYTSPSIAGFTLSAMTVLGEDDDSTQDLDGLFDSFSTGVTFSEGDLYLALAHDSNVDSGSQEKDYLDINRFVASYKLGNVTLGAIVQNAEDGDNYSMNVDGTTDDSYDEDSHAISAALKSGKFTYKLQYGGNEIEEKVSGAVTSDMEETWLQLGVDYKIGKKTKLYAYASQGEIENNLTSVSTDEDRFGLGIEHKF